jgi:tetratricopeptide (TPR) repeat protein
MNSDQTLSYVLPDSLKPVVSAVEKDSTIGAYFAISCSLPTPTEKRINQFDLLSKRICILWDASFSRSKSPENRLLELNALKNIFDIWLTRFNQIEIILIIFRNNMEEQKIFQLQSNNWNNFLKIFEDLPYDGATNLSQLSSINLTQTINYYFLFSDCISTINNDLIIENLYSNFKAPIWIFNGNHLHEPFDFDFIRYLIQYNQYGGGYLNREKFELNSNDLINMIETVQIQYNKLHSNLNLQQIYPSNSITIPLISDRFLLVGQIPYPLPNSIQFELEFSMNNQTTRLPISVDIPSNEPNHFGLIRRLWAQQKLNKLNAFKDKYKSEILSLGLEYSLVSQFTSLLVLETLQQHLQYRVCPAKSRTLLYNQYMQYQTKENDKKTNNFVQLMQRWNQTCQWYDHVITDIDRHRAYLPKQQLTNPFGPPFSFSNQPVFSNQAALFSFNSPATQSITSTTSSAPTFAFGATSTPLPGGFGPIAPPTSVSLSGGFGSSAPTSATFSAGASFASPMQQSQQSVSSTKETSIITLNEYNPQSSCITRISSSNNRTSAYLIYLNERLSNRQSPSFYFDVASYFFSSMSSSSTLDRFNQKQDNIQPADPKSIEYGLRILTNILELELESPQLYRTVAYKLIELKQWNLALNIFRKIYSLRSDEPQSLRDLAFVLIELGEYDQALTYFKQLLTQTWDERFKAFQTNVLIDLNRLLVFMNKTTSEIDFRLIRHLPVDIRIVVQWDTPDTLIKLSIREPTGQICTSSGITQTDIGGHMTNVSFQSDQPLEYLLRKAVNGIYLISLTYINNAQHSLTGVTTVLVYIYKYFGSINEEKQIQTVRLTDYNQTIDVGQIEFGDPNLEKFKDELEKSKDQCRRLQDQLINNKQHQIQSSIQHINVTCDGCATSPIVGNRYKCLFCPNIDFCQNCQSQTNHQHDPKHPLICIPDSSLYASSIYLQNISAFIHQNTQCATCSATPIVGVRYQCTTCKINFCEKCEFLCLHDISHSRLKIISPETITHSIFSNSVL